MNLFKKESTKRYTLQVSVDDTETADAEIEVRFRVPDAAEAEAALSEQLSDTELFKRFVVQVKCGMDDDWANGVDAAKVVTTPGTYGLIRLVALDIVDGMKVEYKRKK